MNSLLIRSLWILLFFRFTVLSIRSFLPFGLPEIWRQYDTSGVAFRYWQRFTTDGFQWVDLLPSVLNAGDTNGIMAMEFPILNLWVSPAFAFGISWGRSLAYLLLILTALGLTLANLRVWAGKSIRGIDAGTAMLMLPLVSVASIWSGKFMPDYISMVLACIGIGLSWDLKKRAPSIALLTASLLMKPTSAIVFALYLLHPEFKRRWTRWAPHVVTPVVIAFLYYTWGLKQIEKFGEMPSLFAVGIRPPVESLIAFFSDWQSYLKLWVKELFNPFLLLLVIPFAAWRTARFRDSKYPLLLGVIFLQVLAIGLLDGTHAYSHNYYFIGVAPLGALMLTAIWQDSPSRIIHFILLFSITLRVLELSWMDFKTVVHAQWHHERAYTAECMALKKRNPDLRWNTAASFRSTRQPYPEIGMCFGEIQNSSSAPYGFFFKSKGVPRDCKPLDQTKHFVLADCRKPHL